MRNNLKHRTLLERGGLMIEALAMLGLIAVVTPTMYKKSAERTMEVDDINTATTIRSYVSAAEAYMATNYVPLMNEFQDAISEGATPPAQQYKVITNNDLADFLPYKFKSASSLYDYNEPKITVVKNANNLTAFLLFPAKGAGENGLGQERTARIASLVGANGGYVRSPGIARGIGGIWSLSGTAYKNVFPDETSDDKLSPTYSIVASTPNAINGSTQIGEFENPKYLQRTYECPEDEDPASCTDERWRNTMRTDLYLGGYKAEDELPDDNPTDEKMHNIRNIGSLIVGAEEQANIDGATSYGLYIAENIDNTETLPDGTLNPNAKSNAYIGGSLMAGLKQFFVDKDSLNYGPRTLHNETTGEYEDAGYRFTLDSDTGKMTQYGNVDIARNFDQYSNSTVLIGANNVAEGYSDTYVMKAQNYVKGLEYPLQKKLIILGANDSGLVRLDSDLEYDKFLETDMVHGGRVNIGTAYSGKKGKVVVNTTTTTVGGTTTTEYETRNISNIRYKNRQNFPIMLGENTYVEGLLAADQLDTQKLRTASFSSGSEHVDDEFQWFNVDQSGVTIESLDGQRPTAGAHTTGTEVDINTSGVSMRFTNPNTGKEAKLRLHSDTFSDDGHGGLIPSPSGAVRDNYAITGTAQNITLETENAGVLTLQNDRIAQTIEQNQIDVGFNTDVREDSYSHYDVNFHTDGVVNLVGANLRAGYIENSSAHPVFSVNTNSSAASKSNVMRDPTLDHDSNNYPNDFLIAMHGNVLFTDGQSEAGGFYSGHYHRYLSIGQQTNNPSYAAGIEVVAGESYSNAHKAVMIDLSHDEHTSNSSNVMNYAYNSTGSYYYGNNNNTGIQPRMDAGTVYIRKGAVDVLPIIPAATAEAGDTNSRSATEQKGYIAAGRFVANNRDSSGNLVKVPDMIKNAKYNAYNSKSKDGRYDTYMVNPAYTSVMHDIKLTTRGGARLSDILPNFIIKSIYLSTNDKDDSLSNFTFQHGSDGIKCGGNSCPVAGSSYWASPYTGYVPAPQCPPGYSRVLTFTPVSMYMAQAGQLAYNQTTGTDANHYTVEEQLMTMNAEAYTGERTTEKQRIIEDVTPAYRRAKLRLGNEPAHTMKLSSSTDGISDSTFSVSEVYGLEAAGEGDSYSEFYPMVLTGGNKETVAMPFTFQQNTWLKTLSVPMCAEKASTYGGGECEGKYVRSWALLLGFVYTIKDDLGRYIYGNYMDNKNARKATEYLYWNVFPVTKGSLEGTATTYCYFNRSNMKTINESDDGSGFQAFRDSSTETVSSEDDYKNYISEEKYLSLEDTNLPSGYQKPNNSYLKRLNDPTLKYTEEW